MKFAITWLFATILGLITAPIVAFVIALFTFFSSWIAFIAGIHSGLMKLKYQNNTPPAEEEDLWDRHIRKQQEKEQQK
jgi:CBS domain containing-hemolysin-like protein